MIAEAIRRERPVYVLTGARGRRLSWQLALPAHDEGRLVAVLCLEGDGRLDLDREGWDQLARFLARATGWTFLRAHETDWWRPLGRRSSFVMLPRPSTH